jgi:multidrug efflux pump subunit AcrB
VSLPEFSVRQSVLVNLAFVILLIAGVFAWRSIPVEVFPDISFNTAIVTTVWSGASPDEMERLVTRKIEDEIEDVGGIKELTSSSRQSVSSIDVEWDESLSDLEYESALNELRSAIDRVQDLPDDAEEPMLTELSISEVRPVCMIAVSDVGGVGEFTLREVARDLKSRLESLPGLRKVTVRGERDRELRVYVDKQRALQYDLTLPEISRLIASNNQDIPAGSFSGPDRHEVSVRGLGSFVSAESLARTVVRKNADGTHVVLGDVAEIQDDFERRSLYARYNGNPAVLLGVAKSSGADIRELVKEVKNALADYRSLLAPGVETGVTWDTSQYVDSRMEMMRSNLLIGICCVAIVLWFTVGFRNAMLAIVAIPFAFLFGVFLFPFFGMTINTMALTGFIMVSGMLVDHAIIILENIYRYVEEGLPLSDAIVRGTQQVMWPVIATVATTVAAFSPMLMVSGTAGEFFSLLPKAVIVTLVGSLLEALVVLPAHYLDWGSRLRAKGGNVARSGVTGLSYRVRDAVDRTIRGWRDRYVTGLDVVLAHRGAFLAACLAALFCSCGLRQHLSVDLFPSDYNQLFVTLETPVDSGIEETRDVALTLERSLDEISGELTDYATYVGTAISQDMGPVTGVNRAMIYVQFPDTRENVANPGRVLEKVRRQVEDAAARQGNRIENVQVFPPRNGPPVGTPVAIRINADDYQVAKRVAGELKGELASIPGVFNIEDNLPVGQREVLVKLDEHRASLHGLSFLEVGTALRAANDGLVPSTFKDPRDDEDVDIRVMLPVGQRTSLSDLLDAPVRARDGHLVKLGDVAEIQLDRSYQRLYHFDGDRAVVVYADVDKVQATSVSVNREMEVRARNVPERYPGVKLRFGGEFQATAESMAELGQAFLLAVIAIYAILAAQFRSYLQPIVVMSVIGFAYIGVVIGMFVMDFPFTMGVIYAVVGLAGIVVNDSLVLMAFANEVRASGARVDDAIREAAKLRFRPILLTTVTTVAGLAPLAFGLGGSHPSYRPFASAIVFGLMVASLLTLFMVPALYLTLEGLKQRVRRPGLAQEVLPTPAR